MDYEGEMNESFEYVDESDSKDELDFISEVSSGDESSELSIILKEMKSLRMENDQLKNDNSEIKQALKNVLTLQMLILKQGSRSDLESFENEIDSLKADNLCIREEIYNAQEEISNVKYLLKKKTRGFPSEKPIETEINGEWKLVESENLEEFLFNQPDIFPFEANRIRFSNVCFEMGNNQVKTCNWLKKYSNLEVHNIAVSGVDGVLFTVKDNKLISIQKSLDKNEEIFSTIERYIEDGKLYIVWERDGFTCERVYEKLGNWSSNTDPFENSE